jgi:hypothetical protein
MTKARGFHVSEPTDDELRIALIDLDDTLAYGTWHPKQTKSVIGEPIWDNIDKVMRLYLDGYTLRIYTARPWAEEGMILAWCNHHEIPISGVICGKPLCNVLIDDKALNASAVDWSPPTRARVA